MDYFMEISVNSAVKWINVHLLVEFKKNDRTATTTIANKPFLRPCQQSLMAKKSKKGKYYPFHLTRWPCVPVFCPWCRKEARANFGRKSWNSFLTFCRPFCGAFHKYLTFFDYLFQVLCSKRFKWHESTQIRKHLLIRSWSSRLGKSSRTLKLC